MTASMTKKHFEALAAALKDMHAEINMLAQYEGDGGGADALIRVSHKVASVCARFNSNFDRARFLKACGVEG